MLTSQEHLARSFSAALMANLLRFLPMFGPDCITGRTTI